MEIEEAIRLDRRLVAVAVERGHRHGAALADAPRLGLVDEDPEQPRLQRGPLLEPVDSLEHAQPRLLHDLLGDSTASHVSLGQVEHRGLVAVDQLRECRLVAVPESHHHLPLLGGRARTAGVRGEGRGRAHRPASSIGLMLTSSMPKCRRRSSTPCNSAWSSKRPVIAVLPVPGSSSMSWKAEPSASLRRPFTTIRYRTPPVPLACARGCAAFIRASIPPTGVSCLPPAAGFTRVI